jgi:acyl-CoA thioesterase
MDGALAFLPLTFTHRFLLDAAACSSLEFSLRFMTPIKWISSEGKQNWFLQEQCTEAGSNGRTFSTGRMWDTDGNLIAVMTQMGIMRGNEPLDAERAKL